MMTGTMILLIRQMTCFVDSKARVSTYITVFGLLLASSLPGMIHPKLNLCAQTITWQSGFVNYVVPVTLLLFYVNHLIRTETKRNMPTVLEKTGMFLLGFLTCLCLETVTLYLLIFSSLLLFQRIWKKHPQGSHLYYWIGNLVGSGFMFLNSSYQRIANGSYDEAPRRIGFLQLDSVIRELNAAGISTGKMVVVLAVTLIVLGLMIILPCRVTNDSVLRMKMYFCLISVLGLTLPILFANGDNVYLFSVRLYFPQYVLIICYGILLIRILKEKRKTREKAFIAPVSALLVAILAIGLLMNYWKIHQVEIRRETHILQQKESEYVQILVEEYPKELLPFIPFGELENNAEQIKKYYNLSSEVQLIPILTKP